MKRLMILLLTMMLMSTVPMLAMAMNHEKHEGHDHGKSEEMMHKGHSKVANQLIAHTPSIAAPIPEQLLYQQEYQFLEFRNYVTHQSDQETGLDCIGHGIIVLLLS